MAHSSEQTREEPLRPEKRKSSQVFRDLGGSIALLAALVFLSWCCAGEDISGPRLIICLLLCVAAGLVCLLPKPLPDIASIILFALLPPAVFLLIESMTHSLTTLLPGPVILELILFWIIFSLCCFITGHMSSGYIVAALLTAACGLVNYYVLAFRSNPILPWDLRSAGTAFSVAANYSFEGSFSLFIALTGIFIVCILAWKCGITFSGRARVIGVLAGLVVGFAFCRFVQTDLCFDTFGMYDIPFTQWMNYRKNGLFIGFIQNLKYIAVEVPEGYSPEAAAALIEAYIDDGRGSDAPSSGNRPNIIVIVDEAFSDLSVLGDLETSQEVMPYYDLLAGSEDTITGTLCVSVLGGNTANSEFEFLTGASMAFLPAGSVPYQQFITRDTPSLAWMLRDSGYTTVASHPYGASGWNRNAVFPRLGFSRALFENDFTTPGQLRIYRSDEADFAMLERISEEYASEDLFQFNITMQNHGSYFRTYDDFTPYISVGDRPLGTWPKAETYLSLINTTDTALSYLIGYYEECGEDTVIVFFGDHQPTLLENAFFAELLGKPVDRLTDEEAAARYEVPFLIWANFDIEEATDVVTSANYLSLLVADACGIGRSDYMEFLARIREDYPVVTANFYYDAEGEFHRIDGLDGLPQELQDYALVQYGLLFDPDELSEYCLRG